MFALCQEDKFKANSKFCVMKAIKWHDVERLNTSCDTDGRRMYDKQHAQIVHLMLDPLAVVEPHSTPVDVVFYVLEGEGTIVVGDEKIHVDRDAMVESPANIPHALYNESKDKVFRVLVIKLPNPKSIKDKDAK